MSKHIIAMFINAIVACVLQMLAKHEIQLVRNPGGLG